MSRQRNAARRRRYHNDLVQAIGENLPRRGLPLQVADRRVRWTPRLLVICAILTAWQAGRNLTECFGAARETLVKMYYSRRRPGWTVEGFLKILAQHSDALLSKVVRALQAAIIRISARRWRWSGWVIMGADGSRVECPMTRSNELGLGCAGKKRTTPQVYVTTVFQALTGLPWSWRRDRGDGSERGLLRNMLGELPRRTLLLMDAGFTGYELLKDLLAGGHDFIVRVGSNVRLLRRLGYDVMEGGSTVYLWPKNQRDCPPLVLRLVVVKKAKHCMHLLTSVRDTGRLSDAAVAGLYRKRWGVELLYRTFKRTLEHHKLRSDTPERAMVELDWSMVGLCMLGLMTLRAMGSRWHRQRWSAAGSLDAVRGAMRAAGQPRRQGGLKAQLRYATQDDYSRNRPKRARHWPHKKTERPPGTPKIRMAARAEIKAAQALRPPTPSG